MSEKLYDALEVCLSALETGADPTSVLNLYPEMQEQLGPLLEASRQARRLAAVEVPEAALQRGRARVLGHAAGLRASAASARRHRTVFRFQRLAVSLAVALLFLFSSTGLVRVSAGALPGDNLYPVKRTWEDVRLLFQFNPQGREELETAFERERLHEVDELLAEGRHETIAFRGVVTKQDGALWVVSGVPVQVTPATRLPARPVTPGTAVYLQGRTNAQGYVEAEFVERLEAYHALPTREPVEAEPREGNTNEDHSTPGMNENGNENENEGQPESPADGGDQGGDDNGNGSDQGEDGGNDHSGDNQNDREDDGQPDKGGDDGEKDGDASSPDKGSGEDGSGGED